MTYVIKLRADGDFPAMTVTVTNTTPVKEDPILWKAHLQYDDTSRQASASFTLPRRTPFLVVLAEAFRVLSEVFPSLHAFALDRPTT